jgi:hypothetical protein
MHKPIIWVFQKKDHLSPSITATNNKHFCFFYFLPDRVAIGLFLSFDCC